MPGSQHISSSSVVSSLDTSRGDLELGNGPDKVPSALSH